MGGGFTRFKGSAKAGPSAAGAQQQDVARRESGEPAMVLRSSQGASSWLPHGSHIRPPEYSCRRDQQPAVVRSRWPLWVRSRLRRSARGCRLCILSNAARGWRQPSGARAPGLICVRGAGLSSAALVGKRLLITSSARSTSTPVADSPGRDCERSVQSLLYLKNRPLLCVLMI
jgi:hypothetical protein